MSYHPTHLSGVLSPEQTQALTTFTPDELAKLPLEARIELALRHEENKIRKHEAFWSAVQGIAVGVIPILVFLGFARGRSS